MNTNEKSYIKVLKGLFEKGEEEEIKKLTSSTYKDYEDYDFKDEQELETYLLGEEEEKDEFDDIPSEKDDDDELSIDTEHLKKDVSEEVKSLGEDLLGEIGIEDLSK